MKRMPGTQPDRQQIPANQPSGGHDVFEILLRDHGKMRELLQTIGSTGAAQLEQRKELFSKLEHDLLLHMEAEERFLYTALEQHERARQQALEGYEEHQLARTLLGTFTSLAGDDERWPAKFKVLHDLVRHHLDQEERTLFTMARDLLEQRQLAEIASKVQELKSHPRSASGVPGRSQIRGAVDLDQ